MSLRRNALVGNEPAKVSNVQKTEPKSNKRDQEVLKNYAAGDMAIYAIDPAKLVPTMCHCKLPTTIFTLLTLSYFILSSVAKMHAACSCSPHSVLHSRSLVLKM